MAEELEEQTQPLDLSRYFDVVRRRHIVFLGVVFLGWGIVWGVSWLVTPGYTSSTLILVEPPSVPSNYVLPNVSDDLQGQMQSITQQITSRTRLLQIIEKLHLYEYGDASVTPDQKVDQMRNDITIELVRDPHDVNINAFKVSYTAAQPHIAQQVTTELTKLFINENLSVRQQQSQDTTRFLQGQLNIARANLAEQDAKVRAFEAAHQGSLPTQEASNLQILSGLQSQLQNEQDALNTARQQRVYHESMIDQYRALNAASQSPGGARAGLSALDQQLETLRSRLANLRSRYTDRFPEVQEVKSEITRTERERSALVASLEKGTDTTDQSSRAEGKDVTVPGLAAPLVQLQGQVHADEIQIANRERSIAELKSRINEYQARLSDEPAVAQQLSDLSRGYTQSQNNYNDLLKKVSDSQMATSMEQMQQGERFTTIDPPSLPLQPDSPNHLKMCGVGFGVGLVLGLLTVALLEFFDERLHTDREIETLLPMAVLSEIPEIVTPVEERRKKRQLVLGWTMAVTVAVVILASAAFSYLSA